MNDDPLLELPKSADTTPTMEAVMERLNVLGISIKKDIADLRKSMEERLEVIETRIDRVEGMTLTLRSEFCELRKEPKDQAQYSSNLESRAS